MCLSTVFEVIDGQPHEIAQHVSSAEVQGNQVTFVDIMGSQIVVEGKITNVDLIDNKIYVESKAG